MFNADKPIFRSEQDRLGRSTFTKYLARAILDHKSPESLVIALYGGWGVGKTSIVNLVLEELHYASNNMFDEEKPIILNFSPWSYSGQQQLIYSFFRRLSSEMRRFPHLKHSKRIIHLLELYVSFFTHKPVPKALRPKHSWWTRLFNRHLVEQEAFGWEAGRDLTLVKAELNELLAKQKHKIIIMIDKISMIEDYEIKQIFQIVKSIGDFANTVYFLSCDKNRVIQAINNLQGNGVGFLEKIVQMPFEVPPISKQDIETILLDRLRFIIRGLSDETWDRNYWADIYYSTLKYFFDNVRDIMHYINKLSFTFERVKEVVNPVDFFALTAIEVFSPKVYYGIRDNKDLFTDLLTNVYLTDKEKLEKDRARCEEILQRSERIPPTLLLRLMVRLFPRLRNIYATDLVFYHSETLAHKNKRICSPDLFDIYFRLSMPTGYIPESEAEEILALGNNENNFSESLVRLNQEGKINKFLDLVDSYGVVRVPHQDIPTIITALMDNADLFPEGETTPLSFNTPSRIHRIFHQLLHRLDNNEERTAVLRTAIEKANKSLYIIVNELSLQEKEHLESDREFLPIEHRDLSRDQLLELQKLAVEKIEYWNKMGRLVEHPKLIPILYAWKAWGKAEDCKLAVRQMVKTDRGIIAFLEAVLKTPIDQAISKLQKNREWEKHLAVIEEFIPIATLSPHAKTLFEDQYFEKLREREQLAILIFLDLIKADTVKVFPKTTV